MRPVRTGKYPGRHLGDSVVFILRKLQRGDVDFYEHFEPELEVFLIVANACM